MFTCDMQSALGSLFGKQTKGLSANSVYQLKQQWEAEYDQCRKHDLSKRQYVYILADSIYCKVRINEKLCLLIIIGVDDAGHKEVLAVVDGYRESEVSLQHDMVLNIPKQRSS
uniref:transposase n=1 Tax=Candidatus Enterovibrio escicola TaxID=1927127 RepID=UPI001CC25BDE|nr:transposase [Candidatus Enterovibrio escacola]